MSILRSRRSDGNAAPQTPSTDLFADELGRLQDDHAGFQKLAGALKTLCGIDLPLTPKNLSLMASRMRKVLGRHGMTGYGEFIPLLESGDTDIVRDFVQAMTTNTTHFFREDEHFNILRAQLGGVIERRRARGGPNELRVWCAASSTGQEPYSILMTLLESGALPHGCDLKFLATDIDLEVLGKASQGIYREEETANIPPLLLGKYFEQHNGRDGNLYRRMKPQFSQMIRFAQLNLIEPRWPFEHKFDIIFCRNVLIYFDGVTAQKTTERLAHQLCPGGLMFVGHSECGHVRTRAVKTVAAAAYQAVASGK